MRKIWKRFFRRFVKLFNIEIRRSYHGSTIVTPVQGGMKVGIHTEEWMLELLRELLAKRSGAFVDVGANLGQTLLKVKHLAPDREYLGFEPNPVCVGYLNRLIECNSYSATIVPAGLSNADGVVRLTFYSEDAADSTASLIANFRAGAIAKRTFLIPAFRFDSLLALIPEQIAIIKIDVEGAECEALEGMTECLKSRGPLVLFEMLPVYTAENTVRLERQNQIEAFFKLINYTLFRVIKNTAGAYAGLQKMGALEIHGDMSKSDYLAVSAREAAAYG